jgi:hypothetical protein
VPLVAIKRPAIVMRDGDDVGSVFVMPHRATLLRAGASTSCVQSVPDTILCATGGFGGDTTVGTGNA